MSVTSPLRKASDRILDAAFLLLALFIPFSIAGDNNAIGLGALGFLLAVFAGARRRPLALRDPIFVTSLAMATAAIPSVIISQNGDRAFDDWSSYWLLLLYPLVAGNVGDGNRRWRSLVALGVAASLAAIVAYVQRAGGLSLGPIQIAAEHRVSGTLHTMTFAGVMYVATVVSAALALWEQGRRRWLWLLASAMQFVAVMLTMTRGAWLALAAGLFMVVILVPRRAVLLTAALMLALLIAFSFVYGNDEGRTLSITELLSNPADRNVGTRLVLWDIAIEMFREHPWLGVGMGDFTDEAEGLLREREVRTTVDTHNVFLHTLATRGVVGFIPLMAYWVVILVVLWRDRSRAAPDSLQRYLSTGAIAATVAMMVGALTENNVDDEEIFIAFSFVLGLARSVFYSTDDTLPR